MRILLVDDHTLVRKGLAQLLFVIGVVKCVKGGAKASERVWEGADGLEWTLPSPPPYHSFETPPLVK